MKTVVLIFSLLFAQIHASTSESSFVPSRVNKEAHRSWEQTRVQGGYFKCFPIIPPPCIAAADSDGDVSPIDFAGTLTTAATASSKALSSSIAAAACEDMEATAGFGNDEALSTDEEALAPTHKHGLSAPQKRQRPASRPQLAVAAHPHAANEESAICKQKRDRRADKSAGDAANLECDDPLSLGSFEPILSKSSVTAFAPHIPIDLEDLDKDY